MFLLDTTVADRITHLKHSRGLPDEFTEEHVCSGRTCTYSQVGDAFLCEKTGRVHGMTSYGLLLCQGACDVSTFKFH
jgi:hypothetical protein